jgi:N-acetylneuraminate synthase/N,N'-diacetyllegionaminate synthase
MKTGIIILSRMTSRRLPGKALREVNGRTILGHIVDRVRSGAPGYPIVVATSNDASDDRLVAYCRRAGLQCFRGSLEDVAERFVSCAEHFGWDFAVRINGDNVFSDPGTLRSMLAIAETNAYDLVSNIPGRTFPFGVTVEIVRVAFHRQHLVEWQEPGHHEHVTLWFYEHPEVGKRFAYRNKACPEAGNLQLALDTEADLERTSAMMARMRRAPASYTLTELVNLATKPAHPNPWSGKCGPLLVAEIGGNHEGDFAVAKRLTEQAIVTGVDSIKFQLYRGDTLVSGIESPDRNKHFKRFELSRDQHIELASLCREAGVQYMASIWDLEMLEYIDPYVQIYKVGSGDLTAWPLVREFARRGKPILLSTGLSTLEDVLQTVGTIQTADKRYCEPEFLCLLQCTSMYPIKNHEANLCVMDQLRQATGLAVGYSDHTEGSLALRVAAAMGAEVLEFHFTDSREGKVFRDHKVSLTPEEVGQLQVDLQEIQALRGDAIKLPQATEVDEGHVVSFRRGTYLRRSIEAGERIQEQDLVVVRPNHGIDARDADLVIGTRARRYLEALRRLNWEDLQRDEP